ncbi:MAG: CoB--CoM heterodisulfide reductase iron-sulfur subunit B family protein [Methanosarcinaceae archaeon]|nr:CoB--CoM heterodisulfide reductase iron-sulfur subunit B family protein [Methanosarcinaceae archaeon]
MTKYSYYPGCTLHGTAKEYDISTKKVFDSLDIKLKELKDWNCCGAIETSSDKELSVALSARNIVIAKKKGHDILIPCSICFHNTAKADLAMTEDEELRAKVEEMLDTDYESVNIRNILDVIVNDLGLDALNKKVTKPLTGIKAIPYYGCLLTRPSKACKFDNPTHPVSLDNIITAVGAESLPFEHKVKCCGGSLLMGEEELAFKLAKGVLDEAKQAGADCIVTTCPMCHSMLDGQQDRIEAYFNETIDLPVLYISQFIGLALGHSMKDLGINKNMVPADEIIKMIGGM